MFSISGAFHQLASWKLHAACGNDFADMQFFLYMASAMCFEAALEILLRNGLQINARSTAGHRRKIVPPLKLRLLGFIWIVGVFLCLFPIAYYRRVQCIVQQAISRP
jgi:hypothetical protein